MSWSTRQHGMRPHWEFQDDYWRQVFDPPLAAHIRIIGADRLSEPDACCYESASTLRCLFGADDLDAMGGSQAVSVLASLFAQFGSCKSTVPVILKAIRKPVTVMVSNCPKSKILKPHQDPVLVATENPRLVLYHSGATLCLPGERDSRARGGMRYFFPDQRHTRLDTAVVTHHTPSERGGMSYAGEMRTLCTHPDTLSALKAAKPVPTTANGPSINLIRLTPKACGRGYLSTRFGINFSSDGRFVTGLWTRGSDFEQFLAMYPSGFREAISALWANPFDR